MNLNIFNNDNELSEVTIANYVKFARSVNQHIDNESDLNDFKLVSKSISNITDNINSQRNYYSAVIKYLRLTNVDESIIKPFTKKVTDISHILNKKVYKLKEKLVGIDYNQKVKDFIKKLDDKDYSDLSLNEFMLSLYVLLPPRRLDYINMIYTTDKSVINNMEHNYIFHKGRSIRMVFNKYKTSKTYGQQTFFLTIKKDFEIRMILRRRGLKSGEFIYHKQERQFRKDMNKITLEVFGVEMNVQDLRVMYNTHKFQDAKKSLKEMKEDAAKMAHSVSEKVQMDSR